METGIKKKRVAVRLDEELLNRLKKEAKKSNSSLNSYVECVLADSVYIEPNKETIAAIEEARAGKSAGIVDTSSMETFVKSCEE